MADYSEAQLIGALRKADAAGDVAAARAIAKRIQAMRTAAPAAPATPKTMEELTPGISTDPTTGMSGGQRFAAGAGKAAVDTPRGLRQGLTEMASLVAPFYARGGLDPEIDRLRQQASANAQQDAPLMNTGAGLAGNIVGQVGQVYAAPGAGGAGLLTKLGNAAAQGGAYSALQPVGTDDSRTANAALGAGLGAGGQGIASGLGRLAGGVVSRLDPITQALAKKADQAGIRLGVGDLSQNPAVRTVLSQLDRLPFSGGRARAEANQEALNAAVGRTFGAPAPKITPDVFAAAKQDIGDTFNALTARNDLQASPQLMQALSAIAKDAQAKGTRDSARMVKGYIDDLVRRVGPNGTIPGRAYQALDSELGAKLKSGGDPAHYLGQVRSAVRAAMDDSISPADRAAWAGARQKWAALKTVEPLVANAKTGDIPAAQLMGRVTSDKAGKARMATGRGGDLGELARIGQRFLKAAPNSGTADRLLVNAGVAGGVGGLGVYSPETALWTGALLLGNRGALKALSSRALVQGGNPVLKGLARLAAPAPRVLPAAAAANNAAVPLDIGMVIGYPPGDPRYRGD